VRVLVCGGREYADEEAVARALYAAREDTSQMIRCIIEGGALGADRLARKWASRCAVPIVTYQADWQTHGKAAGPIRNQRMLDEGKPDLVVAFPGGRGTADMVRRAKAAGVRVIEVPA
jgi:predicted Rossmann-fold nucleotide-binding protein